MDGYGHGNGMKDEYMIIMNPKHPVWLTGNLIRMLHSEKRTFSNCLVVFESLDLSSNNLSWANLFQTHSRSHLEIANLVLGIPCAHTSISKQFGKECQPGFRWQISMDFDVNLDFGKNWANLMTFRWQKKRNGTACLLHSTSYIFAYRKTWTNKIFHISIKHQQYHSPESWGFGCAFWWKKTKGKVLHPCPSVTLRSQRGHSHWFEPSRICNEVVGFGVKEVIQFTHGHICARVDQLPILGVWSSHL